MKIFIVNNFSPVEQIGGSEIQCWLLAKYLAKRGYRTVYLALQGLTSKKQEEGDGFTVFYLCQKGKNKLKLFINFYKFFKKERPDICYIRVFRYLFLLNKICKILKIPVIFNTSHINDCQPRVEKIEFSLNPLKILKSVRIVAQRYLNFSTLKGVEVITINKYHAELLKEKYNIEAIPIYNSMEDNYEKNRTEKKKQIVWVNNIKERKRPEIFIKLAQKFKNSDYEFLMIGEFQSNIDYYKKIIREYEKQNKNFRYLGIKSIEEVDKILAESEILVNTCEPEGFGNNFIQAWFNECPTITLSFDPDNIIENNKIGYHSGIFKKMVEDAENLMNDGKLRTEMGKRARKYALQNHNIDANIKKYESFFKKIAYESTSKKN